VNETVTPRSRALRVAGVSRAFAGVQALQDVNFSFEPGQIFGLIGPNGAGKSTLVNIISGYDRPDTGSVSVDGTDVTASRPYQRARNGIARTFQHGHLFSGLSVKENLIVTGMGTGKSRKQAIAKADALIEQYGLASRADHPCAGLPHGIERLVGVARALCTDPKYILLDEPAAGLNEGEIGEFTANIQALQASGLGVLLIDHNVKLILNVCDRIHVLVEGKTLLEGTPTEVRGSEALAEAYLGKSGSVHRG